MNCLSSNLDIQNMVLNFAIGFFLLLESVYILSIVEVFETIGLRVWKRESKAEGAELAWYNSFVLRRGRSI